MREEVSFTVGTAAEFLAAVPHVDEVSLILDGTRQQGETEQARRRRLAALLAVVFERYSPAGRLTRGLFILVDKQPGSSDLRRATVRRLKANGRPGARVGRVLSPTGEAYAPAAGRRNSGRLPSTDHTALLQFQAGPCVRCRRDGDGYWLLYCEQCEHRAAFCEACATPGERESLDSRVGVPDPVEAER
jgi:hypothetical protein